ncbi:right-handed parallel beta-helix repeat-containing protein [Acinetobacter baumannii]|nr:right-handed parallel beta-helix repeat-containing protein [Acinetobacter baumannii]MDC4828144.1 right-handed parallel beta-helix repeat-containing protein [Acinetobacter baumannii]
MPLKIINPSINDIAGTGIYIGEDTKGCIIENPNIQDCKNHGIAVSANSDITISEPRISKIGGHGIYIYDKHLLNQIGLPESTDLEQLKILLISLKGLPKEDQKTKILESFLSGANNISSIVNNILQILPNLPSL